MDEAPVLRHVLLPDENLAVMGARASIFSELGMSPRDLPDGSFVASQLCSLLALPAFSDIENLDAPIGSGTGRLFAVARQAGRRAAAKAGCSSTRTQMSRCTYSARRRNRVSLLPDSQGRQLKRREGAGMGKSVCEYTGARTMGSSCCAGSLSTAVSVRLADIGCKDYRKPPPQRVRAGEGGEGKSAGCSYVACLRRVSSRVVLCLVMTRALLLSVAGCSCAHASGVAAVSSLAPPAISSQYVDTAAWRRRSHARAYP